MARLPARLNSTLPSRAGFWVRVLLLLSVSACAGPGSHLQNATPGGGSLHLRVLATHDLHGALLPSIYPWSEGRPVGGMVALSAQMDALEAECACVTVRVDGGDQMQGTLESNLVFGTPVVAAFNELRLDAAAVGNHELDWGEAVLLERQDEAQYPWLAANVFRKDDGTRPAWVQPYAIVERGGLTVGIVGYATRETPATLRPAATDAYEFRDGYDGIRAALDAVWQQQPDFVIVTAHAGGDCAVECAGELVELAAELPPGTVHMIAGGHIHAEGTGVVNSIPIVRAGANGRALAVVDLRRLEDGSRTFAMARDVVYADDDAEDAGMSAVLEPYLAEAARLAGQPVTTLAETLTNSPTGDRRLGNLVAESARQLAGAQVGFQNPGGVRSSLSAGPVTYGDVFKVLPFDNKVVVLTISGLQLRQLAEQAGSGYYYANLIASYDIARAPGNQLVSLTFVDGSPLVDEQLYTLSTVDFLADGGDLLTLLTTLPRELTGVSVLDALLEQLRAAPLPAVIPLDAR